MLLEVNEDDLEQDLGVKSMQQRNRVMSALAQLKDAYGIEDYDDDDFEDMFGGPATGQVSGAPNKSKNDNSNAILDAFPDLKAMVERGDISYDQAQLLLLSFFPPPSFSSFALYVFHCHFFNFF